MTDISFIIVNWNTRDLLLACLVSIYRTVRVPAFEIWLVDNGSSDGSVAAAKERFPGIHAIENLTNLGFAAATNLALARMRGRYAVLLNTDATLTDGAVDRLYDPCPGTGRSQSHSNGPQRENKIR